MMRISKKISLSAWMYNTTERIPALADILNGLISKKHTRLCNFLRRASIFSLESCITNDGFLNMPHISKMQEKVTMNFLKNYVFIRKSREVSSQSFYQNILVIMYAKK